MKTDTDKLVDEYLEHYGILGMKWGVRKSNAERAADARARRRKEKKITNVQGGLKTRKKKSKQSNSNEKEESSGKESSGSSKRSSSSSSESPEGLSTKELQEKVNRLNLEKQLKSLTTPENKKKKNIGIRYIESLPDITLRVAQTQTERAGNKVLGGYIDNALKAKRIPTLKDKEKKKD